LFPASSFSKVEVDVTRRFALQVIQGKKGAGGIIVAKSLKAIVIGSYSAESGIQVREYLSRPCSYSFLLFRPGLPMPPSPPWLLLSRRRDTNSDRRAIDPQDGDGVLLRAEC